MTQGGSCQRSCEGCARACDFHVLSPNTCHARAGAYKDGRNGRSRCWGHQQSRLLSVFCTLLPVLQAHALSFQCLGSSEASGVQRGHRHAGGTVTQHGPALKRRHTSHAPLACYAGNTIRPPHSPTALQEPQDLTRSSPE